MVIPLLVLFSIRSPSGRNCHQISVSTCERREGDMHTVLGVLILDGSSRDRCGVPRPVDEPATFFGENN